MKKEIFLNILILFSLLLLIVITACKKDSNSLKPPFVVAKGTLEGVVKDSITQFPVVNAKITTLKNQAADTTDTTGWYKLEDLEPGTDTIFIKAPDYDSLFSIIEIDTGSQLVNFDLKKVGSLNCIPLEDTGRVYINPDNGSELPIYSRALFIRFYPWVTVADTALIYDLLERYDLTLVENSMFIIDGQIGAYVCVNDPNSRSECYHTPWGQEYLDCFGSDPLVEYSFSFFSYGYILFSGRLIFEFNDSTSQNKIDSLFAANNLRYLYKLPGLYEEFSYYTLITPKSKKNVIDLAAELNQLPYITNLLAGYGTGGVPGFCER